MVRVSFIDSVLVSLFYATAMLCGQISLYQPDGGFVLDLPTGPEALGMILIPYSFFYLVGFYLLCVALRQGRFSWWKPCVLGVVMLPSLLAGVFVLPGMLPLVFVTLVGSLQGGRETNLTWRVWIYYVFCHVLLICGAYRWLVETYWIKSSAMYSQIPPLALLSALCACTVLLWVSSMRGMSRIIRRIFAIVLVLLNFYSLGPLSPGIILWLCLRRIIWSGPVVPTEKSIWD
jgi:hypothetical protein